MGIICAFLGAMVGGCIGVVVISLAVAAKRADQQYNCIVEESGCLPEQVSETKMIEFTDANGRQVFAIPDDTFVVLTMGNGERTVSLCQYLDKDHAKIDGIDWQLQNFAEAMEKRGISISPPVMYG